MDDQGKKRIHRKAMFQRGWTQRFQEPIRYERFSSADFRGEPSIFFRFHTAPGESDLPQEIYDLLQSMKHLDRPVGRGAGPWNTGLQFRRDPVHGRVWRLNDDEGGRYVADMLDEKLLELAEKINRDKERPF